MVLGRERREERRAERAAFGLRGSADRYQMREKLLSIGDDLIADESGRRVFKVDGKAFGCARPSSSRTRAANRWSGSKTRPLRFVK